MGQKLWLQHRVVGAPRRRCGETGKYNACQMDFFVLCVGVGMSMHTCGSVCGACMWRTTTAVGCLPRHILLYFLRQALSLKLELTGSIDCLASNHKETACTHICWDTHCCCELLIYSYVFIYMSVGNTTQVLMLVYQAHS